MLALSVAGSALMAQTNPVVAEQKATYTGNKTNLIKAAEKMPEGLQL